MERRRRMTDGGAIVLGLILVIVGAWYMLDQTFGMTLTGVKKHVRVLEAAGLVTTRKAGRVRTCTLGPRRMEDATAWLAQHQAMLEARLDRLGAFLERQREEER